MRHFSVGLLALLALVGAATPALAQDTNRAGVVVVDGAGESRAFCVAFPEDEISGYELLRRTGLTLNVEASAMGATICAVDGEGCAFPAESCFCQCQGSPCVYWSYWTLGDDDWRYETLGAGYTRIHDGDVQGWRWGAGTVKEAQEPPLVTLDEICEVAAGATVTPTVTVAPSAAPTGAEATAARTPAAAAMPDIRGADGPNVGQLWIWLGVLAVPLVLGGLVLRRRR